MSDFMKKVPMILVVSIALAILAYFLPYYIVGSENVSYFDGIKEMLDGRNTGQGVFMLLGLVFLAIELLLAFLKKPVPCIVLSSIYAFVYYYDYFDLYSHTSSLIKAGIGQIILVVLPALIVIMSILLAVYKGKLAAEKSAGQMGGETPGVADEE